MKDLHERDIIEGAVTSDSESRVSKMASGIGSGQNSSGTKLLKTLLMIGTPKVGHTFKDQNFRRVYGESAL